MKSAFDKKEYDSLYHKNNKATIKLRKSAKKYKDARKEYEQRPDIIKKRKSTMRTMAKNLTDTYVCNVIMHRTGVSIKTARKHPDWIESYRLQIKLKRLIKLKKHGCKKTN